MGLLSMTTCYGIVRAVNSGDSISVWENKSGGTPSVRDIYLTSVQAPKLGYNNGEDKPWAWQSREFLRDLCIGKKVKVSVEHKTANGREYGNVETDTGLNLAVAISEAGWAEIRSPPDGKEPRTEEHKTMLENQERAKEQKIGIFQEDQSQAIMPEPKKLTTMQFFDAYKEKPLQAIIEYVRDASCFTVVLKDSLHKITLRLAGVSTPRVPSKKKQEEGEKPEPFGVEAKFFVERHLLHRTVNVTITIPCEANRKNEFYGTVEFSGHTVTSQLLRNGYAKLVEWSAPPQELESLKACQQEAKAKKLRVWKFVTEAAEAKATKSEWNGKIREVRDGSSLVIQDSLTDENKFVILSNVKVPRMGKTDCQPFAYEAREFIRKKALGKKVLVHFDYENNDRIYATVYLDKTSLAVLLVEEGLANVTSYEENAKSPAYQQLTVAENRARSEKKNLWNKSTAPPVYRATDTTLRSTETEKKESKNKAKQFVGALQRAGRVQGIIEHIFNGSRFKINIPKQNVILGFGLEAIRTPSNRESDNEPLGKEVYDFVYDKLYQRDVELIVDSVDQAGNFFGSLFFNNKNFGVTLLEMGYARVNQSNVDFTNYASDYKAAEAAAKEKGIRIWAQQAQKAEAEKPSEEPKKVRLFKVRVSEVIDGNWFYLQMTDEQPVLNKIMSELNAEEHPFIPNLSAKRGGLYCAKMPDDKWYRVKVEKFDKGKACVVCVDYGNGITVDSQDLRPLSPKLASAPVQAKECRMAYIEVPSVSEDYGEEAAQFFYDLSWGKDLLASVEYTEGDKSFVGLGDGEELINAKMVEAGFGVVPKNIRVNEARKENMIKTLRSHEASARKARRGRYEYGDFRDDD